MKHILILFPNQLFEKEYLPLSIKDIDSIVLIEDPLFFYDKERLTKMNLLKRMYQRASMKYYEHTIKKEWKKDVNYIEFEKDYKMIYTQILKPTNYIHWIDPVDHTLRKRFYQYLQTHTIHNTMYETPMFFITREECLKYGKGKKKVFQTSFYIEQRKRLGLWVDSDGKPKYGKWTFDTENRKPFPKHIDIPSIHTFYTNEQEQYIKEARKYVERVFEGNLENKEYEIKSIFPIDSKGAKKWYDIFLKERFRWFGMYQDAIKHDDKTNPILYHSGISCVLNNGLLTPKYVIERLKEYIKTHKIPFSSVEGFIRQIIGWREHCRLTYEIYYHTMKKTNILHSKWKLGEPWYNGTTGIKPIDDAIHIGFQYGYLHHILRLMVMGTSMLMLDVNPDEAMKWFYEMSCDSYEWNMINNVKCMAMWSDGGKLYTTKPYISTSNYLLRMSDYKRDGKWDKVWDGMYWIFLKRNEKWMKKNGRFGMIQIKYMKRKGIKEMKEYAKYVKEVQIRTLKLKE
jgi:deoxyribodipyrimidine photolyase-related protein